jgi:hypothetical protein
MHDANRDRLAFGSGDLGRDIEPEQPRPPLHDAHGRENRPRVARADTGRERELQRVEPPRFKLAQPLRLLLAGRVQATQFVLHIVIRGVFGNVELRADLAVGRARDPQIQGLRGALTLDRILARGAVARASWGASFLRACVRDLHVRPLPEAL